MRRRFFGIVFALLIAGACLLAPAPSSANAPVTCSGLSVQLSDDKNYYVFTASATTTDAAQIRQYKFDFGDHNSYTYNLPENDADRSQATATHTYQKAGDYTASVAVYVHDGPKTRPVVSDDCRAQVAIAPQNGPDQLVNTGPGTAPLLALTAILGGSLWWRARLLKQRADSGQWKD